MTRRIVHGSAAPVTWISGLHLLGGNYLPGGLPRREVCLPLPSGAPGSENHRTWEPEGSFTFIFPMLQLRIMRSKRKTQPQVTGDKNKAKNLFRRLSPVLFSFQSCLHFQDQSCFLRHLLSFTCSILLEKCSYRALYLESIYMSHSIIILLENDFRLHLE